MVDKIKKNYLEPYDTKEQALAALERFSKDIKRMRFIGRGITLTVEKYQKRWWIVAIDRR